MLILTYENKQTNLPRSSAKAELMLPGDSQLAEKHRYVDKNDSILSKTLG